MPARCFRPVDGRTLVLTACGRHHLRMSQKSRNGQTVKGAPDATADTAENQFALDRIYFDTSALWADRWPNASTSLLNLVSLARSLGIRCLMPEPVLVEIEQKWIRELYEKERELNSHTQRIDGPRSSIFSSREDALAAHKTAVTVAIEQHGIEVIPFTSCPLSEIFRMSAGHEFPFAKDTEFRDRIIWLSIVENLGTYPASSAIYLCQDSLLDDKEFKEFAAQRNVKITIKKSPQDVSEVLLKRAHRNIAKKRVMEWTADSALAKRALEDPDTFNTIREFIVTNLVISDYNLRAVKRVCRTELTSVQTAFPTAEKGKYDILRSIKRKPGEKVKLSLLVEVNLEVRVRKPVGLFGALVAPPLRVGEETKEMPFTNLSSVLSPEEMDEQWTRTVTVEATGVFDGKGYTDIEPISLQMAST
jgi:PIN domain